MKKESSIAYLRAFFSLALMMISSIHFVWASSYETLPKGINMLVFKQVMTSKIESKFDSNHNADSLALKEDFNSSKLENISSALNTYFQELKTLSPEAYSQFSLGEFKANANAEVSAQGVGFAHGITEHLTVYGSIPVYHMKTNVIFQQTKKSNLAAIQAAVLNSHTTTATSAFVRQLTLQLPETNEQLLQSVVVNYYGYKALGTWERDALGDTEIGGIYRLTDLSDKGFAISFGAVLPTGLIDDPDSLQDVSTGDGQYDAFIEAMSGVSFLDNTLQFDFKNRFTYQFGSKKLLRTSESSDLPLSQTKELMNEKLGNKLDSTFIFTVNVSSSFNLNASYIYNQTDASIYDTKNTNVKSTLEYNSYSNNQWARLGIGFSGLDLYRKKKLDIPFELNLSAQKLLNAKNAANYERFDLDLKLFF